MAEADNEIITAQQFPGSAMSKEEEEETERCYQGYREMITCLPKAKGWRTEHLYLYKGFWLQPNVGLEGCMWLHQHLKPRPSDVFLISSPKSGSTWLKALAYSILNRSHTETNHQLLNASSHKLVPFLEIHLCRAPPITDPESLPSPRLLATHAPLSLLPHSLLTSGCRIVYVCRDPKDMFVSMYHFLMGLRPAELQPVPLEEAFEAFCTGVSPYGPFWDHVLEYWKAANLEPNRVLFLKYEDLKTDPLGRTKELAAFLGQPFSAEEEKRGEVQKVVDLCSFDKMKNLEVNKQGINPLFYRKGQVGDWRNHLTSDMAKRLDTICHQKFSASQLSFGSD